jgi:predicted Fe-S protein YdhL (DUF1289 family)
MTSPPEETGAPQTGLEAAQPGDAATSPCIRVCVIDGASGLCLGCLRTLREIARWSALSETERLGVMSSLSDRRAQVDPAKLALMF